MAIAALFLISRSTAYWDDDYNDGAMNTMPTIEGADKVTDLEAQVQAQGHMFYGTFADDPGAMDVFDEIERLRDQETIFPAPHPLPHKVPA